MKKIIITIAALVLAHPFAHAGEVYCPPVECKAPICCDKTGYIFGYGGFSFEYENDADDFGPVQANYGDGYILGAGAGIYSDLLCGTRFEIEGIFTHHDLDSVTELGVTDPVDGVSRQTYAVMVNALKEIPLGCVTGYFGGGIGYGWSELEVDADSDTDGALAYQLIVGGDLPISACLSLFAQYKLFGLGETEYFDGPPLVEDSFFTHSVSVGARYSF